MTVTAVVGGQFGSEGKGKIAAYLSSDFAMAVRTGGPNAGHTVELNGEFCKLQMIPCAFVNPRCELALGAGAIIDDSILRSELERFGIGADRLRVDPLAVSIRSDHHVAESGLIKTIGSTGKGVGAALAEKTLRSQSTVLARDIPWLSDYLDDVSGRANEIIDGGGSVLLEGTQGFGLSLHHGYFPFATSRDTTVGVLCSEAGLAPTLVRQVVMVVRTYPIRVAGNSGPLPDEVDWDTVTRESRAPRPIVERTTVTGNIRRVGRFDMAIVKRACMVNRPTQIAVTFSDYIDWRNYAVASLAELTPSARRFIDAIEESCEVPVTLIGTGPRTSDIIDLRGDKL